MNGFGQLIPAQEFAAQNLQLAQQTDAANRQNALQALVQSQGPAAARGDQNALSQIAQMDPKMSQELQAGALSNEEGMRAKQLQSAGIMAGLMNSVRGDPQRLEFVKRFAVEKMGLPQEMVAPVTMEQLPAIIQGVIPITEQINSQWDQEQFMLTAKDTETAFEQELATYRKFGRDDLIPAALESKAKGRGGTSINVNTGDQYGKIPQGFMITEDPNTGERIMQPVPGSEFAGDRSAAVAQAASKYQGNIEKDDFLLNTLQDAINLATPAEGVRGLFDERNYTTGLAGQVLQNVGGTAAHDLQQKLQTLESHIGFDRLQLMREQSPTGGALGSVSERELSQLNATYGSLKQSQSNDQIVGNLKTIDGIIRSRRQRYLEAYVQDLEKFGPSARAQADQVLRTLGIEPPRSLSEARNAIQDAQTQRRQQQGVTGPESGVSLDDRFQQLLSEGMDPKAAAGQLIDEGYKP